MSADNDDDSNKDNDDEYNKDNEAWDISSHVGRHIVVNGMRNTIFHQRFGCEISG